MPAELKPPAPWQSPLQPGISTRPALHEGIRSVSVQARWPLPPHALIALHVPDELNAGPRQSPVQPGTSASPDWHAAPSVIVQARWPSPPQALSAMHVPDESKIGPVQSPVHPATSTSPLLHEGMRSVTVQAR